MISRRCEPARPFLAQFDLLASRAGIRTAMRCRPVISLPKVGRPVPELQQYGMVAVCKESRDLGGCRQRFQIHCIDAVGAVQPMVL